MWCHAFFRARRSHQRWNSVSLAAPPLPAESDSKKEEDCERRERKRELVFGTKSKQRTTRRVRYFGTVKAIVPVKNYSQGTVSEKNTVSVPSLLWRVNGAWRKSFCFLNLVPVCLSHTNTVHQGIDAHLYINSMIHKLEIFSANSSTHKMYEWKTEVLFN